MAYTFKTDLANKANYGAKRNTDAIRFLVAHFTSNDGDSDENNGNYFKNNIVNASAHYFVDSDSVTQSVADNFVAWSVGGKKYNDCDKTGGGKFYNKCTNANSISIEICDDVKNGVVYPSQETIDNAIELTKELMRKYNIPASNVIRHFDVNGKKCPAYWVDDAKWKAEFWNKIADQSQATTQEKPQATQTTATVPFVIKVDKVAKDDVLNIRKEPNANAKITGKLKYNDPNVYTIVAVKNGWGKLKSGIGWVNLKYTKTIQSASSPYYPKYTGNSYGIDTVLAAIGVEEKFRGTWAKRKPIALANGIGSNYRGGESDNLKMIALAKQGKLKKV